MNITELANKEIELYSKVTSMEGTLEAKTQQIQELGIFEAYREIFNHYAKLNKIDSEALKRGLFLMWYSKLEPSCYTGIGELDKNSEEKIIKTLNRRLKREISSYELDWMISYYSNWDYLFEEFNEYDAFQNKLKDKVELPITIDSGKMEKRGQMGIYWCSIINKK